MELYDDDLKEENEDSDDNLNQTKDDNYGFVVDSNNNDDDGKIKLSAVWQAYNENEFITNAAKYEEYLYMLSQYFMKDPKSLTNNLVFHFENSEEDYYPFKFNFYSIKYDYIVKFILYKLFTLI